MRKILAFACAVLVFATACSSKSVPLTIQKSQFFTVKLGEKDFYFKYPADASIVKSGDGGVLSFTDCKVSFGSVSGFEVFEDLNDLKLETAKRSGVTYKAWYRDNKMVGYAGVTDLTFATAKRNYAFWIQSGNSTVPENCSKLVEDLAGSLTDRLIYTNQRFGLSAKLPADFKMDYLPGYEGFVLKKWIDKAPPAKAPQPSKVNPKKMIKIVDVFEPYKVEMGINFLENFDKYKSIADYVGAKYPGFTFKFADYGKFSGYYVNETLALDAVSHFFVLKNNTIYDLYMRVPGKRYEVNRKVFEDLVGGAEIN